MRNKLLLLSILLLPIIAFSQKQINPSQNARIRFSHASQIQLETLGPGGPGASIGIRLD